MTIMGLAGRLFATVYDPIMAGTEAAGLRDRRRALLAGVKGDVLEIGAGTGANLDNYGTGVTTLSLVDPEPAMVRKLEARARDRAPRPLVLRAPAEDLPFEADSFDVVVSTLVLCTVADQSRALREIRRVLRPGGELRFIEHVRSDEPRVARWQDRLNGVQRVVGMGCNCNRSTLEAISAAGFTARQVDQGVLAKAPPLMRPLVMGTVVTGEPAGT
jgi:ubiquinone/menaquinone biosynthesis C-methylase UbiE